MRIETDTQAKMSLPPPAPPSPPLPLRGISTSTPNFPASMPDGSRAVAGKRVQVALALVALGSLAFDYHLQTRLDQYEAIMTHTNVMHHDPFDAPYFDERVKDCVACGVKIKSVSGR